MSSPQEGLFRLPELLHQILLQLSNEDISNLMVTNKVMRDLCAPYLYHTLDLTFTHGGFNILESTQAKRAISKNAYLVQKLTVSHVDLCFLFNCLRAAAYRDTQLPSPSPGSLADPNLTLPSYLPPLDIYPIDFVPINPMINLTDLTLSLTHVCAQAYSSYRVPSFRNSRMTVAQACWVISLSPRLVNLTIHDLVIKEHREVRLLGETIYELSRLRLLDLKLLVRGSWHSAGSWYKAGSTIVFNCPRLIQKLRIDLEDYGTAKMDESDNSDDDEFRMQQYHHTLYHADDDMDEDMDQDDDDDMDSDDSDEEMGFEYDGDAEEDHRQEMDYDEEGEDSDEDDDGDQQPEESWSLQLWESQQHSEDELMSRPDRCEPLMELVEVKLWNFVKGITEDEVVWLFEHCCKVKNLAISSFEHDIDPKTVANIIKSFCTRIRRLTFKDPESEGGWNVMLPFEVLTAMPDQQLREIDYRGVKYKMTKDMVQNSIIRHSAALTIIVFKDCQQIASDAIQAVLVECTVLNNFQVSWHEDEVVSFLHLADAIATPWGSNKFTRLSLTIGIPRLHRERGQRLYYQRAPRCVLSLQEKRQFAQLECLYRQLASLQDLVHLDLRALATHAINGSIEDPFYFNHTFPAMMSLADTKSGRPGFLELFAGWTKLEVLRGSFNVSTDEALETMGCPESTWLSKHWPKWKEGEFFQGFDESREVFVWLEDYRQKENPLFSLGLSW
ncbi:hypothetical protein BG015_007653 [Linnemannia schmuckeri]|uniref:F-box domain-containing protein n=1 Tax=Linnemannia schmuckeri TaxID=64567 RepID=A0A9P5VAQ7_9FUNG|nr:hypothetical protein BG015_007653 [Linnemannia schmuckeri]